MLSENNRLRALKSALYSTFIDFKTTYGVFLGVMTGFMLSELLIFNVAIKGVSSSNASALNSGMMTAIIALIVSMIVITSNSELLKKFSFPVDRNTLVITHIIFILVTPLVLLLTSCTFYLIEYLLSSLTTSFMPGLVYRWIITKGGFLTGFISSYILIVCISALTYCLFAYFYRFKIITSVAAGTFILLLFNFPGLWQYILDIVDNIFFHSNPVTFFLKLLSITVIALVLAYIPIKGMEVKK